MTRIGCTGHQNLPPVAIDYITAYIQAELIKHDPKKLVGVCALAVGADQLFARLVLDAGGAVSAIIPCKGYETTFASSDRHNYQLLLDRAFERSVLDYPAPTEEAFLAAGRRVAEVSDLLIAVWDGEEAHGKGGTGDVVEYAVDIGIQTIVIWPDGATR